MFSVEFYRIDEIFNRIISLYFVVEQETIGWF